MESQARKCACAYNRLISGNFPKFKIIFTYFIYGYLIAVWFVFSSNLNVLIFSCVSVYSFSYDNQSIPVYSLPSMATLGVEVKVTSPLTTFLYTKGTANGTGNQISPN